MKRHRIISLVLLFCLFLVPTASAQASAIVRAVLFYSPTCGHCQYVITETLMPMIEKYGERLQIIGLDITQPQNQQLYMATLQKFGLDRGGVPFLVVDNIYLVGSVDIPEKFPGLVERYLQQGGVDWPDIPGLGAVLPTPAKPAPLPATPQPDTASPAPPASDLSRAENLTWRERFALDPKGNTLSVIVLFGMFGALGWAIRPNQNANNPAPKYDWSWLIPILCVIGFGVAGYLAYVETAQVEAVCGPVGDCNTVQQSQYARLFGILPIGVLGLIGYIAILVAWLAARYTTNRRARLARLALFGMTLCGTLFSIYLTFLEPVVIGATCAWCLTSSLLMTGLMLLTARISPMTTASSP